jgi:hypothetical protein
MAERRGLRITTWNGRPHSSCRDGNLVLTTRSERDQVGPLCCKLLESTHELELSARQESIRLPAVASGEDIRGMLCFLVP